MTDVFIIQKASPSCYLWDSLHGSQCPSSLKKTWKIFHASHGTLSNTVQSKVGIQGHNKKINNPAKLLQIIYIISIMSVLWHYICTGLFKILFGELSYLHSLTIYLQSTYTTGVLNVIWVYNSFCLQLLIYTSCTSSKLRFHSLRSQDGIFPQDFTICPRNCSTFVTWDQAQF